MNKWTLKFENQALENQFQAKQQDYHKTFILKVISISSIVLHIGKLIQDSTQNNPIRIELQTPGLIISIIALVVIFRYPQYSSTMMILLNYSFSLVQFWVDSTYGQQRSFLLGSNVMASQMLLMMSLDFYQIVPQIVIQLILKLIIMSQYYQEHLSMVTVWFSVLISVISIVSYYLIGQAKRQQFLLTVKEDIYSQFLTKFISVPFILFEYQQEQFQPIILSKQNKIKKWNPNLCDGCNLRSLIRYITFENQTLENYLLEKYGKIKGSFQSGNTIEEFSFAFRCYSQIDVIITITDKINFLVKFTGTSQTLQEKVAIDKINHFYRLIREVFKCIKKPQKYKSLLFDISIQFISGFYLYGNKEVHYYPVEILKNVIRFIGANNILLNAESSTGGFSLIGSKNQFSVFFLQICRILIIINNEHDFIVIRVNISQEGSLVFEFSLKWENLQKFQHLYKINQFLHSLELVLFEKSIDFQQNCQLKMKRMQLMNQGM
ncbi:unnamed protein product (macronuclear) [Paramecium tetraurelia]|uniref:Transmembrane protein n=1 Tax=Paramecium tetraurelia TaxID=5888 RepID=A0E5X0_PARTE|nr:uncharacterized protein GSPATT00003550001 [Paramecium tetraurelia]CAK90687.1 unnamed protein product [Paramecium tetraurelia]|eukprot:XP_001458084.1 hypothetical protein (macronuclear) [Paramecium tetraurelia strain d4-2]